MSPIELHHFLRAKLSELGEHFDAVQIMGSFVNDDGETESAFIGSGNWYARVGMARELLEQDQSRTQAREIKHAISNPPDL